MNRKETATNIMLSLSLTQFNALRQAFGHSAYAGYEFSAPDVCALVKLGVLDSDGNVTALGYDVAYESGYLGKWEDYADELTASARISAASQLQMLYLSTMNMLGKEHTATQALWLAFVEANELAQPHRVKAGQVAMQEQIDRMTAAEWSAIVD